MPFRILPAVCRPLFASVCLGLPLACSAQALLAPTFTQVNVQYGGNGATQTTVFHPTSAAVSLPEWEASASLPPGHLEARVDTSGDATANTYAAFNLILENTGGAAATILGTSVALTASFAQIPDGGDGSLFNRVIGVWVVVANGVRRVARVDHTYSEICQNGDCRKDTDTGPVTEGGGSVAILSASSSFLDAVLSVPGFTLAPGASAQFLLSLQTSASAGGGWAASVDATNSAQASMQLGADTRLAPGTQLSWVTQVPEPATLPLAGVGLLLLGAVARYRRGHT